MNIVISGPGGVGKGTLVARLVDDDRFWLSRSWTTRERRPGEAADAYVFASRDEFRAHVDAGGFLEWVEFLDYLQGTPVPVVPDGVDVIFEIDVHGAVAIADIDPTALLIFIDTPDVEEQRRRLVGRGDAADRVAARIAKGDAERVVAEGLGMRSVINDDLDRALAEIRALIDTHRGIRHSPDCDK